MGHCLVAWLSSTQLNCMHFSVNWKTLSLQNYEFIWLLPSLVSSSRKLVNPEAAMQAQAMTLCIFLIPTWPSNSFCWWFASCALASICLLLKSSWNAGLWYHNPSPVEAAFGLFFTALTLIHSSMCCCFLFDVCVLVNQWCLFFKPFQIIVIKLLFK